MSTPIGFRRGSRGNGRHVISDDRPETAPVPAPARVAEQRPRPSFRPARPPAAETAPIRPVPAMTPVIGDSMTYPDVSTPDLVPPQAVPGNAVALYHQPGWAGIQMDAWVRNGEWESPDALTTQLDRAFGDVIAGATTASRHVRDRIAHAAGMFCTGTGHPEQVRALLRMVDALASGHGTERRAA